MVVLQSQLLVKPTVFGQARQNLQQCPLHLYAEDHVRVRERRLIIWAKFRKLFRVVQTVTNLKGSAGRMKLGRKSNETRDARVPKEIRRQDERQNLYFVHVR